jgi:ribosomal-protein-alanine N-acetyltransferase
MTVLQTPRLILRPWVEEDAAALFSVFGDAEAMRHWNAPPVASVDALRADIAGSRAVPPEAHLGWAVTLRDTGEAVGFVNYHHRDIRNRRLEIGYILARAQWRQGITLEAVAAMLDHCFGALAVHRAEATVSPANQASIRFLERLGFMCEGGPMRARMWTSDGRSLDALMFGLLAPDWQATRCDVMRGGLGRVTA